MLKNLLEKNESEGLDFKECYHKNKAEMIHDILCLANSKIEGSRWLVFGVTDNKEIKGIKNDENRKTQAMIIDMLRNSNINILPTLKLITEKHNGEEVDMLVIRNLPEKPYYLLKDKTDNIVKKRTVRAGVVYTRNGDTNTPMDGCTDDKKVENMFRERFGIDKSPMVRIREYLDDIDNWNYDDDSGSYYYKPFPEFTINQVREGDVSLREYSEPWVKMFPDPKGFLYDLELKYFNTTLKKERLISCDGGRYQTIQPKLKYIEAKDENGCYWFYYFINQSIEIALTKLIEGKYSYRDYRLFRYIFSFHDTHEIAENNFQKEVRDRENVFPYFFAPNGQGEHIYYLDRERQGCYK